MQSHVSSKEKHIEQGLYPEMGVAVATGLNVTSQHEDMAETQSLPTHRLHVTFHAVTRRPVLGYYAAFWHLEIKKARKSQRQ